MTYGSVLITGVHTGLGYALAKRFIDSGSQVYAVSRSVPEDLVVHPNLHFLKLDLRSFDAIPGALRRLLDGVSALELAVLNAGVLGEIKDLKDTSLDELRAVMDVNVWANKLVVDALLGHQLRVSQIVAISSAAAFNGSGGWGAYCISKAALNLLVRVYAHEHPQTHFAALAPGIVKTNMIYQILAHPENPRYPANGRIRRALAESRFLSPAAAAVLIQQRIPDLLQHPSGKYVDIRQM